MDPVLVTEIMQPWEGSQAEGINHSHPLATVLATAFPLRTEVFPLS